MTELEKRVKKKKKKSATAPMPAPHYSEPLRPITSSHRPQAERWGAGPVIAGFLVCLGLGGATGYLFTKSSVATTASKDSATAAGQTAAPGGAERAGQAQQPGAKQQPQKPPQPGAYIPIASWTPVEGPAVAKVTIVEFSDYQ